MAIAFFDLDNTLLAVNSAALWLRRERRSGRIGWWQAARAAGWMLAYRAGFTSLEAPLVKAIASLAGLLESEVRAHTGAFYEAQLRGAFRPGGLEALRRHREAGDDRVLLTSSSSYLAERVSQELGLEAFLSNRFEVDPAGRYTGRSLEGVCFGEGKLVLAESHASARRFTLAECSFYTDSFSDLPLLKRVGRPVAVNPDLRLRRHAKRRGWEVVDWGAPPVAWRAGTR